jgi:hypothetical protein
MPKSYLLRRSLALSFLAWTFHWSVEAADIVFTNANGGNWNAASNWSPNQIPGSADNAWITNNGTYTVTNSTAVTITAISLGAPSGTQTLRLTASTLIVTNTTASSNGVIVLNGGSLTTTGPFANAGRVDHNSGVWRLFSTAVLGNYNFVSGELRGGTLTVTNMNWTDGNMNADANGDKTIIAPGGVLNFLSTATRNLSYNAPATRGRDLDNYGTWNWTTNSLLYGIGTAVVNNYGSVIATGGAGNSQFLYNASYASPTWNNYGSFTKASGAGNFYFQGIYLNNSGSINAQSGTLWFYSSVVNNSGPITIQNATLQSYASSTTNISAITLDANSFLSVDAGGTFDFGPTSSLVSPGVNHIILNSASTYLRTTNITSPNIWIAGGNLYQHTNIAVAAINESSGTFDLRVPCALGNFNLTNGELRGRDLTVTNFNWYDGNLNCGSPTDGVLAQPDRTIIPVGGTLNILGSNDRYFSYYSSNKGRGLDNYGTINWSAPIQLHGNGGATVNNYGNVIVTGGSPNVQYDYGGSGAPPIWNNYGTFTRTTGSTYFYFDAVYLNNLGVMSIQSGTLSIYNSYATNYPGATIQMSAGTILLNDNTSITQIQPGSTLISPGLNSIQIPSGQFYLASTNVSSPSFWISGGNFYQQTNIAVPTMNMSAGVFELRVPCALGNFNMTNGELRGRDLTITNCNWFAGNQNSRAPGESIAGPADRTTIPPGGVMNILGTADRVFSYYTAPGRGLDNYGTINWSAPIQLRGNGGATVNNYGNVLVTAGSPNAQFDYAGSGAAPIWNNFGTFTRTTSNTFFYFDSVYLNNTGTMDIQTGTLSIYGSVLSNSGPISVAGPQLQFWGASGTNYSSISVAPTTLVTVDNGSSITLAPSSSFVVPGYDKAQILSGSLFLNTTNVATPSFWIAGGSLLQQTNIVVPTVNMSSGVFELRVPSFLANFNMTNGELRGRDLTVTNCNWFAGNMNTSFPGEGGAPTDHTIIPSGGVLNILGTADRVFSYYFGKGRGLENYGTINWNAPIQLRGQNSATVNNYGSVSVTAGSPNVQFDFAGTGAIPVWNNYGTFTRSATNTIFYFDSVYLNNTGLMDIQSGTLSLYNSFVTNFSGGNIQAASGVTIANDNTAVTALLEGSTLGCASPNAFQINSGNVYLRTLNLFAPSLLIAGGVLHQQTNNVVPTINESSGTWKLYVPTTATLLNQTNGEIRGADLTLDSFNWLGGNLNADGPGSNTVTVTSALNISGATAKALSYYTAPGRNLVNNGVATWGGANITAQGGASIFNNGTLNVTNDVALQWGGTGNTPTLFNAGTFAKTAGTGTANFSSTAITNSGTFNYNVGNLTVGGNFVQTNGSSFLGTNFTVNGNLRVEAGTLTGKGNVTGYLYNNGALNPGASPGLIAGATFTNSASSIVNIELAATNAPGTNYDQIRLTGAASLTGTMNVSLFNNFAPQLSNSFIVMRFGSRVGTFPTINPPPGVTLQADYSTTNLILTVIGLTNAPLQITSFPSDQIVWTPDPVTFNVGVSGTTPISYQWQLNGTNLLGATNSSYSIAAVAPTNAGTYTVQIADNFGATTNASALLTVIPFDGTIYWTNVVGGNWSVPANWLPNRVPGATNVAVISSNGNYTVSINTDAAARHLLVGLASGTSTQTVSLISGNTLALGGNSAFASNTVFQLNGLLQTAGGTNDWRGRTEWYSGTLSGAGRTIIATNAEIFFTGSLVAKYVATNILENHGQFTYSGDLGYGSGQLLRFSGGAQLTNYASGVINMKDNALQYSGAQTPRSYLVNYGTIRTTSPGVFSPSYISIDFINYGLLQNYGYVYISRGTNYGEFYCNNGLAEISIFGDPNSGEYFSFEPGTTLTGVGPNIACGGPVQWRAANTIHNGNLRIASGSGGATFPNAEFRILVNYTNRATVSIARGALTIPGSGTVTDLHVYSDGIYNSFHSFGITNAGTMYADSFSHSIYGFGNSGTIVIRTNASLDGGSLYGGGHVVVTNGASAMLSGTTIDAQWFENFGSVTAAGTALTGNTRFENKTNASVYFQGSLTTGPASVLSQGTMSGYGGMSGLLVTNRNIVLANDSLGRNLALATYRQESGLTECGPGTLSGSLDILGGTFDGDCSLTGTLRNSATFSPGKPFGLLTISGDATNTASGVYNLPIKGAAPTTGFPQVRVGGTANLAGTLNVIFTNGFIPGGGNLFTVMVFTARSGVFDQIINDTYGLEAFYTSTTLVLRAENLLPNVSITTFGGTTQLVCTPFKLAVTSSDPDGVVTNLLLSLNGTPIGGAALSSLNTTAEFDFPGTVTFTAAATDDRGGTRYVSQQVLMTNAPLHILQLGGVRTNAFKICMLGETGSNYMLLATTNLAVPQATWTQLGLMENTNGIWRYLDVGTITNRPLRFYRALQQ